MQKIIIKDYKEGKKMMLWLYILLAIFTLLSILVFAPISLKIEYKDDLFFEIKILFLKFKFGGKKIYNSKKKKKEKKQENFYSMFKKKGVIETIKFCFDMLKITKSVLKGIIQKIQICNLDFKIKIGDGNAYNCAIKYTQACAVVYTAATFLIKFNEPKKYKVNVIPDFLSNRVSFYFNTLVKTKMLDIFLIGIYFIKKYNQMTKR